MISVSQLGYLVLGVSDLEAWNRFAEEILGLEIVEDGTDRLFLRLDEYHHRLMLQRNASDDLALIGWQVDDEAALVQLKDQLSAAGVQVEHGTAAEAERRRVVALIKFRDPNGISCEAFYGPLLVVQPPRFSRPISGFVAGTRGLGHITMAVDDLGESLHFYRDVLGLRLSDWVRPQPEHGVQSRLNIAFLHCNPRHHTLAFWQARLPHRLHHFMLQLNRLDDVGIAYQLCQDRGVPFTLTLGRHTNDQMLSFYARNPSGFSVEYGWGAREVDEVPRRVELYETGSVWGHRPPGADAAAE